MKLGLALGGGGARGAAHIGFLMEMRAAGLQPDLITGASAGGIVGALVAAGIQLEAIADLFRQAPLTQLFSLPAGRPGLTDPDKAAALLEGLIGRPTFDQLRIPLAVITVDLVHRREVILDEGDVISAVLATAAFPILTPPVERDGLILIDGGVLNNVPFDIARARGATYVIAIDLSQSAPYGTPVDASRASGGLIGRALSGARHHPMWQIAATVSDILTLQGVRARMAISPPDILVQPRVGTIGLLDFNRTDEGIELGRRAAQAHADELAELAKEQKRRGAAKAKGS